MRWTSGLVFALLLASSVRAADGPSIGRVPSAEEVALWDIDVDAEGRGLPEGSGSAQHGKEVYQRSCIACHGPTGEGGIGTRLVGGQGTLASNAPVKTIGSYWPYAPTLFDYIRRAMPYTAPQSLGNDDVYAVTVYLLSLNGIVAADATLDRTTLPKVLMPNRKGFVPDNVFERYDERQPASKALPHP